MQGLYVWQLRCKLILLQICNEELFGSVAEEKEVEGITGKLKEAKSTKSFEIYKIISKFVTKETLPKIILPLKEVRSHWFVCE